MDLIKEYNYFALSTLRSMNYAFYVNNNNSKRNQNLVHCFQVYICPEVDTQHTVLNLTLTGDS